MKRHISLLLRNGNQEDLDKIKAFCKDNNVEFEYRYKRTSNNNNFGHYQKNYDNKDIVSDLYYFFIIGNTNDYEKLKNVIDEKLLLTDHAEICNVADLDDSFEEDLNECLKEIKRLQCTKEIVDRNFLNFVMPIKNIELLKVLSDKYSCYMSDTHQQILRDRIDILSGNREVIDEELTSSILSLHNDVKELRNKTGMSRREFCDYFEIPYRTVEDWEKKKSSCSTYLFKLMQEKLINNGYVL